jgi:HJR/Mrr/RecB family endonuclease
MTTEKMEAYCLEEGDQILVGENIYRIVDIEDGDNLDYRFVLVDEEGYRRHIETESTNKFSILISDQFVEA